MHRAAPSGPCAPARHSRCPSACRPPGPTVGPEATGWLQASDSADGARWALLRILAVRTRSPLGLQAEGHPLVCRTFSPKILPGDTL